MSIMSILPRALALLVAAAAFAACSSSPAVPSPDPAPPPPAGDAPAPAPPPSSPAPVVDDAPFDPTEGSGPPVLVELTADILYRHHVAGADPTLGPHEVLTIAADGRWLHESADGRREGALSEPDRVALTDAIAATRFALAREPADTIRCMAIPHSRFTVEVPGHPRVSWLFPCAANPDPTVRELRRLVQSLTTR